MGNSRKYLGLVEDIYAEAKQATVDLLKQCGDKCFIAFGDWEDSCSARTTDEVGISIFAVGLDDNGELCIAATVDNVGYGFSDDDFEQDWTSTADLQMNCFPDLYRFVADNLESSMTKAGADEIINAMWEE